MASNTDVTNLEPEYVDFIRGKRYGSPIVMARAGRTAEEQAKWLDLGAMGLVEIGFSQPMRLLVLISQPMRLLVSNFLTNETAPYSSHCCGHQDLERYYHKHSQFLSVCVPCGCACPCNMLCWTLLLPAALYHCVTTSRGAREEARLTAERARKIRTLLFPTMVVKLAKRPGTEEVVEMEAVNFLDHQQITQAVAS